MSICSLTTSASNMLDCVQKNARAVLSLSLMVIAFAAIVGLVCTHGSRYHGYSLAYWARAYEMDPNDQRAIEAIHCLATNSLPQLVRQFAYDPKPKSTLLDNVLWHLPARFRAVLARTDLLTGDTQERMALTATKALEALGPDASPAIPALRELTTVTNSMAVASRAIHVLLKVDNAVAPTLAAILLTTNHPCQLTATLQAARFPVASAQIVQLLVAAVCGTNDTVACVAIHQLGSFAGLSTEKEVIIPALERAVQDPRPDVSRAAQEALSPYQLIDR